jgi:hypothetical protein
MEAITEARLSEFAERGYLLLRGVVPRNLIDDASRNIDDLLVQHPPPMGTRGHYFPPVPDVETFLPLLLRSSAFALAESLVGTGRLTIPTEAQVALNIPPYQHRPGGHHLDGVSVTEPDGRPGTFTLLAGILITDQPGPDMGNLWIWPGTHLDHAALFRKQGSDGLMASGGYPAIALPEPIQIVGEAGDLLLAHYLLGHNIGGNTSSMTRRAVYFRMKRDDHVAHWRTSLQDAWRDFDLVRAHLETKGSKSRISDLLGF